MIVLTHLCVSMMDVYIVKTAQTHKDKTSDSPQKDPKNDKENNIPKDDRWSNKKKGENTSEELMG